MCPPSPYLFPIKEQNPKLTLGAQNVSFFEAGAHTGEVGRAILKDLGVEYVIIGHSERRARGEHDEEIRKKVIAALEAGLKPIVCVGEPLAVRELGHMGVEAFIKHQLSYLPTDQPFVIAYEPLWAIGSGDPATPEIASEMALFIKKRMEKLGITVSVLYGGSVKPNNAKSFLDVEGVDGLLVGGASLKVEEVQGIIDA